MASKVQSSNKSLEWNKTLAIIQTGIREKLNQKQTLAKYKINKNTMIAHLGNLGTSWAEELENFNSSNESSKSSESSNNIIVDNTPHSLSYPQSSVEKQQPGESPGTPLKLTEEVLEDALVRVLQQDPVKALGPALTFLDKKKSLSVNDDETEQTEDQKKYYNEVLSNIYK